MTSFIPLNQRRPMATTTHPTPSTMKREKDSLETNYYSHSHEPKSNQLTCCEQTQSSSKQFCSQLNTELNKGCDDVVTKGCTIVWGTLLSICKD